SARESARLTRFIVSTDSPALAEEARRHGAEVPFQRPAELANDQAGMVPGLQHGGRRLGAPGRAPGLVVTLRPPAPLRRGDDIDRTIAKVVDTGSDSAQTVTEAGYHPFFMKTLEGDRTVALFADGHKYVRRQDAPPVYQPSGAVYVTRRDVLMNEARVLGVDNRGIVQGFEAAVNLDTDWDFLLAELILPLGLAPPLS